MNSNTTSVEFTATPEAMEALKQDATVEDIVQLCEVYGAAIVLDIMGDSLKRQGYEDKGSNFDIAVATCRKHLGLVLDTFCNGWKANNIDTYLAAKQILGEAIEHFGFTMGTEEENK